MNEKANRNSGDATIKDAEAYYPEAIHRILEAPGIFVKSLSTNSRRESGETAYPDVIHEVYEENSPIKNHAVNYEFLKGNIKAKELDLQIYNITTTVKTRKPTYNILITNQEVNTDEEVLWVAGHPLHLKYRSYNKKRIYNDLNTLKEKYYSTREISEDDIANLIFCISMIEKKSAKDYLEKVTDFFTRIENISDDDRLNLFLSLKEGIKNHFRYDIKKKKELITMASKSLHVNQYAGLPAVARRDLLIQEKDEIIAEKNQTIQERDQKIKKITNEKNKEIKRLKEIIEKNGLS